MFPEQAVQSVLDINAAIFVPVHWGVFNLGRNPWNRSIKRAHAAAQQHGLRIDVPKQGEKYRPDGFATET